MENLNDLSGIILNNAFKVHSELGPGLLESVYEECLYTELIENGISVVRQKEISVLYNGKILEKSFRADLIVENKIIVEIKSIDAFNEVHIAQILTYLKFSKLNLGLLINFNVKSLRDGLKRVIKTP
jgi:GxxExxY protein